MGKMMYVMEEAGRLAAAPMKDDDSGRETTFASRNIRKWRFSHELGMLRILKHELSRLDEISFRWLG